METPVVWQNGTSNRDHEQPDTCQYITRRHHLLLLLSATLFTLGSLWFDLWLHLLKPVIALSLPKNSLAAWDDDNNNNPSIVSPVMYSFSSSKHDNDTFVHSAHTSTPRTIRAGDLPGYTGWMRPSHTLAHYHHLHSWFPDMAVVGEPWTVRLQCMHPTLGHEGGAWFYVRAYGRSILPGMVKDHGNGTYDVSILPYDEGVYILEVVMTYSFPPRIEDFPIHHDAEKGPELYYEGYLLSDFPLELTVHPAPVATDSRSPSRTCRTMDILADAVSSHRPPRNGRWLVTRKVGENGDTWPNDKTLGRPYERGWHSLGLGMDYVPTACTLPPTMDLFNASLLAEALARNNRKTKKTRAEYKKKIRLVFIGDSNIREQRFLVWNRFFGAKYNESIHGVLESSYIMTNGGLHMRLPAIRAELKELRNNTKYDRELWFVIFNAGLHDISMLCTSKFFDELNEPDVRSRFESKSCLHVYRQLLTELVDIIQESKIDTDSSRPFVALTVWQSTLSSWPKWGVFGAAWPPRSWQTMPKTTEFCAAFNDVALSVMQQANQNKTENDNDDNNNRILIQDAFWLSHSRPDHRMVDPYNGLPNRLMHAGPEVYEVLLRQFFILILDRLGYDYNDKEDKGKK